MYKCKRPRDYSLINLVTIPASGRQTDTDRRTDGSNYDYTALHSIS